MTFDKQFQLCSNTNEIGVKSDVFCMLPWIHIFIMADSKVYPCCNANLKHPFANARDNDLKDIWNNEKYKEIRLNMLNGKKSEACVQCYEVEMAKMQSMRIKMNESYAFYFKFVELTEPSGFLPEMNIIYFDIRFSNICNFKCKGCGPISSSAWYNDYKKICNTHLDYPALLNCTDNGNNKLWQQLVEFIPHAEIINFAGGEPLLIEEQYKALQILDLHKRYDVCITYVTNLSIIQFKEYNIIELWKKFKRIHLYISIDDIESRGEYFRKGLNWQQLIQNLELIYTSLPDIKIFIINTVNIFNIYYFPEIYKFFTTNKFINETQVNYSLLVNPNCYNIQALPYDLKKQVEEKLIHSVNKLKQLSGINISIYLNQVNSFLDFMFKEDMSIYLKEFREWTSRLDQLNGDSFIKVYPELSSLLNPIEE